MAFRDRIMHAWSAFMNKDPTQPRVSGSYYRPDRSRYISGGDRSLATSVYNRISMDAAQVNIRHVRLDSDGRYLEDIPSPLNNCLSIESNIDQTSRSFIQDAVMSLLDEGHVVLVPTITDSKPSSSGTFDIYEMRTGKVVEWFPDSVRVNVYNDIKGMREDVLVKKRHVCIVENPLFSVMNAPNSTLQRLIRKLSLLDAVDEQSSSGKLDLIIQLPYTIRNQTRKQQAEERRKDIQEQLTDSKYGIAYTDSTEKIIQLNRSLENNLMKQIEYLTDLLYSQLGITLEVMNGTADEKTMLNYYNRTIEPIISAIVDEMKRKFLTKTARTQGQSIEAFRNLFKLVPISNIAEIGDKFTRNEILTANELRQILGMKPSSEPKADRLENSNIAQVNRGSEEQSEEDYDSQIAALDSVDANLDRLEESL